MSSPFPIPNVASSPFPIPIYQGQGQSPASLLHNPTVQAPSSGPIFAPSPLSQLISSTINSSNGIAPPTGLTPGAIGMNNGISITTPNFSMNMGITPNTSALLASVGMGNTSSTQVQGQAQGNGFSKESLMMGLNELDNILSRIQDVQEEIKDIENRVFEGKRKGDEDRLIALHTEYNQSLQTLLSISSTNLTSSLPIIPSSDPGDQTNLTITALAKWSEEKAGLEFSKRENLRAGGKAVVDILRASGR
ncbi:hypothetical protein V865_006883 [Kwoniella europaea PYCC6329]|uniref:Uncharacterized protein n=1 Tax=Kwoniella europaea PYCC6329 TaxID=1423913 RepID=A0AAX4KT86_9TREE